MKDGWYIFILVFIGLILTIFFKLKFSYLGIFLLSAVYFTIILFTWAKKS